MMPIDPVCGMQVDVNEALTANYQGKTYYFHSDDCREEFLEEPEDYVMEEVEFLSEDES